jgi:chitinase
LQTAAPTFNPPGGSYILALTVSISDATPGATIYYTRDGSTPTTSSTKYTGSILLNILGTTTIKAIAVAPGQSQSQASSATYNVLL